MREGIIKVLDSNFEPVVCFLDGSVMWGGTKREKLGHSFYRIDKKQINLAFNHLNKSIKFKTIVNRFGETLAQIIIDDVQH